MHVVEKNTAPSAPGLAAAFEALYAADLVYKPGCWKLCGDAHCCHFSRFKDRFRLLGKRRLDLPLLPGEFDFLVAKGWDGQFRDSRRSVTTYEFGTGSVALDTVSGGDGGCACVHDTRTVICRLYPLLPVFDIDGRLVATERMGVFDELETIDALEPACRVDSLPFDQMQIFLAMSGVLGSHPVLLFHLAAYRAAKRHVFDRVAAERAKSGRSAFSIFEAGYLRRRLIDHDALKGELRGLKSAFDTRYGERFTSAMSALAQRATGEGAVHA